MSRQPRARLHTWLLPPALGVVLLLTRGLSQPLEVSGIAGSLYAPEERFGFGVVNSAVTSYDVGRLHAGWYSDWRFSSAPLRPAGLEYYQMVRVRNYPPNWAALSAAVLANPGSVWMIGNEPDQTGQDNKTPEEYAPIYHEVYTFIKGLDPTAQIAVGGIVQPTPLRLQWLDRVLSAYQTTYGAKMPVDVWNIHNQILQEKRGDWGCGIPPGITADAGRLYTVWDNASPTIFAQHMRDFRAWMAANGERNKPLIVSEYGVLMPSSYLPNGDQSVIDFMTATFDFMLSTTDDTLGFPLDENRLVQRWLWYSLDDQPYDPATGRGFNGGLFDYRYPTYPGVITQFGLAYEAYTSGLMATPTPTPTPIPAVSLEGSVSLQRYQPQGDGSWMTALEVTFLNPGTEEIAAQAQANTDAWGRFTLSTDLVPGTYDVAVKGFHTLEHRRIAVVLQPGSNSVDWGELLEGDCNDDNQVDILDYSILFSSFWTGDPRSDLNQDGTVNTLDYSLLFANFWQAGPIIVQAADQR